MAGIKKTLEFFVPDPEDRNHRKRIRPLRFASLHDKALQLACQDVCFEDTPASGSAGTHTVQADQHIFGFGMDGECNMAKGEVQVVCRSVFENTENCCSTARFTQKWTQLINLMEKQKGNMTETRQ